MTSRRLLALAILVLLGLFFWRNSDDRLYREELWGIYALSPTTTSAQDYRAAFDEHQLRVGYRKAPQLWHDSAGWWQGTWIHNGTRYFRPLSSYLHWFHCWGWEHWGGGWFLWLGTLLYLPALLLMALLARRFVRNAWFAVGGAVLLVLGADINGWPPYWLAWFPGQPQFLLVALMAGSLLCFDHWLERPRPLLAVGAALCLVAACLVKEHAYVLPLQLAALALFRPGTASLKARGGAVGTFLVMVLLLYTYRKWVLPDADEPHFRPFRLLRGALTHSHWELRLFLQNNIYDIPLSALGLFGLFFLVRWLRKRPLYRAWQARMLGRIGLALALVAGVVVCFLPGSLGAAVLDPKMSFGLMISYSGVLFQYSLLYLMFKYARRHGSLCPWLLLILSNYPVGAAFGWHYDIIGWQFQLPYAAVLLQIVWDEKLKPQIIRLTQKRSPNLNLLHLLHY